MGLSPDDLAAGGARLRALHYALGFDVGCPDGPGWLTVADLLDDAGRPSPVLEDLVAATAAAFPPHASPPVRARVAAQRFCYLWGWSVAAASLGLAFLEGVTPDPAGDNIAVRVDGHHPGDVTFLTSRTGPADARWWEERVLGAHLDPLHAAVGRRWRLGRRGLLGDLATDVSGVARVVGDLTGDPPAALSTADDYLDRTRSQLRGLGVLSVAGDDTRRVVYRRSTCCLYLKVVPGAICSNCPLLGTVPRDQALRNRAGGRA